MATQQQPPPPSLQLPVANPLEEILTPTEQFTLSDEIRQKLNHSIHELQAAIHTTRTQFHTEKVVYVQHTYDLDTQLTASNQKLASLTTTLSTTTAQMGQLQAKHDSAIQLVSKLGQDNAELKSSLVNVENKVESLQNSNSELLSLVEKRNTEVERLTENLTMLREQLEAVSVAKIEALQKIDELVSREIEVKYREKHLEQQQAYSSSQLTLLNSELERKSIQLLNTQRDCSVKYIQIQSELSEKIEQLKISEMRLADLKQLSDKTEKQVENLMEKLRNEGELRGKVEENYRVEVGSLKRVVELYKESGEDSTKKLEELEDAVQNLQDLLKESTDKYGQLETRFAESSRQFQEEISNRDESIGKLKSELKTANEVLESIQKHGMTDDMIQSLSPAAAAASQMLKESKSITEIFSRYQEVQVELGRVKCDNLKLNGYIREILEDIETRAPSLQKQKEEYERAIQTVEILSSQMDVTMRENTRCKTEIVQLKKNSGVAERENSRLKGQIEDLGRQVRCLLAEGQREEDAMQTDVDGGQVITSSLTTFASISELQQQNLRLLTVVRELTTAREKKEKEHEENSMREIKANFQSAMKELEELKAIRLRQDERLAEIQLQRDQLSSLLSSDATPLPTTQETKPAPVADTPITLLSTEFSTYREEKRENERLLNEAAEKLREEVLKVRSENGRLAGQIEYNNERGKVYNKNMEGYKKQIAVLEERARGLSELVGRHEGTIEALKTELLTCHTSLSRAEVSIQTLTTSLTSTREQKNRLQLEKDMLQRHEKMSLLLQSNLEEIKNNSEMSSSALRIRLENEIDALKSENTLLKRRIDSDADRNRDLLNNSDRKLDQLSEKLKKSEENHTEQSLLVTQHLAKIDQLTNELTALKQLVDSTNDSLEPTNDNLELITLRAEAESLKNQLELAQANVKEYKNLSSVLEVQLALANETNKSVSKEFESQVEKKESVISSLQMELERGRNALSYQEREAEKKAKSILVKCQELESKLEKLTRESETSATRSLELEQELERVREDLSSEGRIKEELTTRLENEVSLRRADQEQQSKLLSELETTKTNLASQLDLTVKQTQQLQTHEQESLTITTNHANELALLQSQLADYREAVDKLELQLTSVLSERSNPDPVDLSSGGDSKSSEQWLQLIRFLRREKEIAVSKMESALAESDRLQSQFSSLKGQYEEVKGELEKVTGGEGVGLLTSVKQGELMRKVENLSALSDSNRLLREETTTLRNTLANVEQSLAQIQTTTIAPLQLQIHQLTQQNDQLSLQNQSLTDSSTRWQSRANELIEKTNKVNPEEMKRLQDDNENLTKKCTQFEAELKRLQAEIVRINQFLKQSQALVGTLRVENQGSKEEKTRIDGEIGRLTEERGRIKGELDRVKGENVGVKKEVDGLREELTRARSEVERLEGNLEEHRNTVKQVKNIARKYKKQYEDLLHAEDRPDVVELRKELESLKEEMQNVKESESSSAELELASVKEELEGEKGKVVELTTTLTTTTTTHQSLLQEKNTELDRLRSELDMTRQRLSLIEKIHRKEEPEDSKLTASIRPMTVKEQKTPQVVVVPQQNVVQPMQQQQVVVAGSSSSSTSNLPQQQQPTTPLQSGPVSQAQVSSSGGSAADFYTQQRVVSIQPHVQEQEEEDEEGEEEEREEEEGEEEREDDEGEGDAAENVRGEVSSSLQQGQSQHPTHPEASSSTSTKRSRSAECDEGNVNKRGKFHEGEEQEEEDMEEEEEHEEDPEEEDDQEEDEDEMDEREDDEDGGDNREREAESRDQEEEEEEDQDEVVELDQQPISSSSHTTTPITPTTSQQHAHHLPPSTSTPTHQQDDHTTSHLVPSTPTLFRASNRDGFAELTTTTRFSFDNDSDLGGGSGRSVPSTPAAVMREEEEEEGEEHEVVDLEGPEESSEEHNLGEEQEGLVPLTTTTPPTTTTTPAEVPSSSTTPLSLDTRPRPTPIVWDQPTSSSGQQLPPQPQPHPQSTFRPSVLRARGGFSYRNPVSTTFSSRVGGVLGRGTTRGRGVGQSARRSRPGGVFPGVGGRGGGVL